MCRGRIFVIEYRHEVMNMNETKKPKYGIGRNVAWMVDIAWKTRKRVIFFCLLTAVLAQLSGRGYRRCRLMVATDNENAFGLYRTAGFKAAGVQSQWFQMLAE